MASRQALTSFVRPRVSAASHSRRFLHQTTSRHAITNLEMPAMSPTMTEGGISSWKKKDGEAFVAGDVLLEIETDKATIDVEAQEDGVMGKILAPDGAKNVPVGKVIALLAEEGDDISNLQPPKEEQAASKQRASPPSPTPTPDPSQRASEVPPTPSHSSTPPSHPRTLFPSVHRLLLENSIANPEKIKGTGVRGMLTKGDVLSYLGKASSPTGTFKEATAPIQDTKQPKKEEYRPLDGPALRQLIVSTMLQSSIKARNHVASQAAADFDSIIADYIPSTSPPRRQVDPSTRPTPKSITDYFDGLI